MNNVVYKHIFGGRARVVQINNYLEKETKFVVELLDKIGFQDTNTERKTVELTEDEFHRDFKYYGIYSETDTKVDVNKYSWKVSEGKYSPIADFLNKEYEVVKENINNKVINLDNIEIERTQKFADLLLTLSKLDLDLESSIQIIKTLNNIFDIKELIGYDDLGRPVYKEKLK